MCYSSSRRRGVGLGAAAAAGAARRLLTALPNRNPNTKNRFVSRLLSSPPLRNPNNHFCSSSSRITTSSSSNNITQQKGISQKEAAAAAATTRSRRSRRRVNSLMMNSNGGDVHFALSPSSSSTTTVLKIQKGDITKWFVDGSSDAIVNAANERMLGGGGVDGAIHRAAGTQLRSACYTVQEVRPGVRCPKGDARITPAFRLPVSHIIHTVGPIYDDDHHPEVTLGSAYRNCLRLCKENNIHYVAFPAISCGVYGYPYDEAASVAISTVKEFGDDLKEVHFVLFEDAVFDAWLEKANELL